MNTWLINCLIDWWSIKQFIDQLIINHSAIYQPINQSSYQFINQPIHWSINHQPLDRPHFYPRVLMIDWLIDWLIDRSIDRLIDWLIDWLIDRSIDRFEIQNWPPGAPFSFFITFYINCSLEFLYIFIFDCQFINYIPNMC